MSVLNFMGVMPSFLCEPENFSREYFHRSKYFLMGISWVQNILTCVFRVSNFFSPVFRGSKFFPCWCFKGARFFLAVFCGSKIL